MSAGSDADRGAAKNLWVLDGSSTMAEPARPSVAAPTGPADAQPSINVGSCRGWPAACGPASSSRRRSTVLLITRAPGSQDPLHDRALRSTKRRVSTTPLDQPGAGESAGLLLRAR